MKRVEFAGRTTTHNEVSRSRRRVGKANFANVRNYLQIVRDQVSETAKI
jgi:hypothetical protein